MKPGLWEMQTIMLYQLSSNKLYQSHLNLIFLINRITTKLPLDRIRDIAGRVQTRILGSNLNKLPLFFPFRPYIVHILALHDLQVP